MRPFIWVRPIVCLRFFFFSSRRRHTRSDRDWSSDVCSSDLIPRGVQWFARMWIGPKSRTFLINSCSSDEQELIKNVRLRTNPQSRDSEFAERKLDRKSVV